MDARGIQHRTDPGVCIGLSHRKVLRLSALSLNVLKCRSHASAQLTDRHRLGGNMGNCASLPCAHAWAAWRISCCHVVACEQCTAEVPSTILPTSSLRIPADKPEMRAGGHSGGAVRG